MKTTALLLFAFFVSLNGFSQSLHQDELLAHPDNGLELTPNPKAPREKVNCDLNRMVFGWHPYWMNGAEDNYEWDLVSDFCFFGYEVDYATGNATSTHAWATNDAVDTALAKGKQVHLCVMLFSNHAAFFGNATARTTLINNLVSSLQSRGAHGINIDFEGVPASQSANLTSFMLDLGTAMHTANPNYKLSICLYAVDWNNVFNETALNAQVDFYTIMGYDYYYSGSSTAGPTDPLYGFSDTYDYSLSRSVSYYLNAGIPKSKLVLGLPYYGKEWETTASTVPSSTTGNNNYSRTYDYVKTNSTGFYTNPVLNTRASGRAYVFQNAGTWRQCWISEENELRDRYDLVNRRDIKGIGIWTLGYDDGYTELWDAIQDKLTTCNSWACSDTLYDEGGPEGNYYNNESFTYTINPPGATGIDMSFLEFNTEANYDTLWIYDGASTASNLIGAFHGTNSPGNFTTSSGVVTLRFKSDGGTRAAGWKLVYSCIQDAEEPVVSAVISEPWITEDVSVQISATDNIAVDKMYWNGQTLINGTPDYWQGTGSLGHTFEDFQSQGNWTSSVGTWLVNSGSVNQTDEANGNTSFSLTCPDLGETDFLFNWKASLGGTGTNRRAGMHFMCSDLTLPNRGNSYFVYLRVDSDVLQIYETTNDVFSLTASFPFIVDVNTVYDVTTLYSSSTGEIQVFVDGSYVGNWIDATPLTVSQGVSLRSGNCLFDVEEVSVMVGTTGTENVLVGPGDHFFNCNPDPAIKAGRVASAAVDVNHNLAFNTNDYNVDFTLPELGQPTDEVVDLDTIYVELVNFSGITSQDLNSGVVSLEAEIRNTNGAVIFPLFTPPTSTVNIDLNGLLVNHQHYFLRVFTCNNAGLCDSIDSDGFEYIGDLSTSELNKTELVIYPNPTNDVVNVVIESSTELIVLDAFGKVVLSRGLEKGEHQLSLKEMAVGTYFFKIGKELYKIVKE